MSKILKGASKLQAEALAWTPGLCVSSLDSFIQGINLSLSAMAHTLSFIALAVPDLYATRLL